MTNEEIIQRGILIRDETEPAQNTSERVGGVIKGIGQNLADKDTAIKAEAARNGYYQCTVNSNQLAVTANGFTLPAHGGNIRIKMSAPATGACTLNINGTGPKTLLYNGAAVSSANTWEQNEIISVFYDPSGNGQYLASNSQGGGADLKVKNTNADLDIADDYDNVVMRLSEGHVKTKNFDSRDVKAFVGDEDNADLDFSDEQGNVVMRVANGHVKTKNFDSSTVLTQANLDTLYDKLTKLNHPLRGKRVAFLGDSITAGSGATSNAYRYSTVLSSKADCVEVNLGNPGTCIAANTKNNRTSERFITRATIENLSACDFVFVFGGTNDVSYDIKPVGDYFSEQAITGNTYMGTKKRVPNSDNESFSGALHELLIQIRAAAPSAQIIFIQMLNRGHWSSTPTRPNSAECNANGDYMQDFRDAIDAICKSYCIPVIPLNSLFGQDWTNDTPSSLSSMDYDGIHPNNLGHKRIAEIIYKWVFENITI